MSINIEDYANSMREPKVKDIRALSTIKDDAEKEFNLISNLHMLFETFIEKKN